jgi:Glycosyl transferase family 90
MELHKLRNGSFAIALIVFNVLMFWRIEVKVNQLYLRSIASTGDNLRPRALELNVSSSVANSVPDDSSKERVKDEISSSSADATSPADEPLGRIPTYSTETIARTVNALVYIPGMILIYNPLNDTIMVYSVAHSQLPQSNICRRCRTYVPVLARSLWRNPRLSPHQAPLQLFFSEADFPYVDMQLIGRRNDTKTGNDNGNGFCPWVQFGSVFRDSTILPTVHAFPFAQFLWCMEEWIHYEQRQAANSSASDALAGNTTNSNKICRTWKITFRWRRWVKLIPKIIWRGSDYACLHTLRHEDFRSPYTVSEFPFFPRRQAVNMSANGETWIDASIPSRTSPTTMSNLELLAYKYQIDLAGAGGTTWTGTMEKLAMPGLLFHHETPAKDWYYDSLKAWQHYVPVRTDLSDLKERYLWAEANREEAKAIADRGTAFAKSFVSYSNVQKVYKDYFGQSGVLSKIVDAYENRDNPTLESILSEYRDKWNLTLSLVSICSRLHCDSRHTYGTFWRVSLQDDSCNRNNYRHRLYLFGQNMSQCLY